MKPDYFRRAAVTPIVFFAICAGTFVFARDAGRWYSILPPLLAVSLAILTGRIMMSLALAVVTGGALARVPEAPLSLMSWLRGMGQGPQYVAGALKDPVNLEILLFVSLVLTLIAVATVSGGFQGVVQWLRRFAGGPKSSQLLTALLGLAMFIDDYANTMIVGTAMRPITDTNRVSREKLAFLVDATSAPIAGLAVVSTWVGYEVGLFNGISETLGLGRGGYAMLFDALPYRFYCIFMIVFVFIGIARGRDFGPMRRAEDRARLTGAVADESAVPMTSKAFATSSPHHEARVHALSAILPVLTMFGFLLAGIWFDGGGGAMLAGSPLKILSPYAWRDAIGASENSILLLACAAAAGLCVSVVCARMLSRLSFQVIGTGILTGARSSLLPITILVLAWSLKAACDDLGTGEFLVAAVGNALSPLWFPALTFIFACLVSFATGTSFGTMAILIPTAVPIAFHLSGDAYGLVTIITLAAILDGSILGDHCSPISDTTIMSSIACSCDHMHHVNTQLPYSLTVGMVALCCGYVPAALGIPPWLGLAIGTVLIFVLFTVLPATPAKGDTGGGR